MVDFPGEEEISMKNDDLENNYKEGEQASRNVIEENRIESSEEDSDEVKAHGWCLLPKRTYDAIKQNKAESWREIHDQSLKQESPKGNTVLHIAALYGNDRCVERILEIGGAELLTAKNRNGDTPLHVAARAGKVSTLHNLVAALVDQQSRWAILTTNNLRNTLFHEALLNGHKDVMKILDSSPGFRECWIEEDVFLGTNKEGKSVLHLAFEKGYEDIVDDVLTRVVPVLENYFRVRDEKYKTVVYDNPFENWKASADLDIKMRKTRSIRTFLQNDRAQTPLIVAILKQNKGILEKIVKKKKEWIHKKDTIGRNALHYAASIGYLHGVEYLLQNCHTCNMERDKDGIFPLHLASAFGHIKVLKKLLENCPDPREIVDNKGRNIVHIAAIMGEFNVVRYFLQDANNEVKDMINGKDCDGNTPLHLAASHYRPKIVQALTWDTRVDLHCLNNNNQTALDAFEQFKQENNPPFPQRLTWCQLKSAGIQNAKRGSYSIKIPRPRKPEAKKMDFYKDRIDTLMVVSTLITTVAFAAGFTLPGGNNSSNPGQQGMSVMLNHMLFKPFIFCITTSMYGGISVTIILIWAQLGDITLALLALKVAIPLLGITLATLSMAFLAGVHLVISDLSWLATTILIFFSHGYMKKIQLKMR
ncbi:protein ACCELERATED CELL DEATH 6-like isoform X2 [Phaseolus vulgaris]|uniref:protein ACCELERATED CELL DEATH 6-like isoform X2 n=1 Tax=Phaseolus vulgaris TaxID=3885 RepID=UPI0035CB9BFE